jgi:hypothetical protein
LSAQLGGRRFGAVAPTEGRTTSRPRNGQEDVHAARPVLPAPAGASPTERLIVDPLRLLAWGTDASFYRLVPKLLVVVDDGPSFRRVLACCARLGTPVTFRAAGTSLSGRAIQRSVLIMLGDGWRGIGSPPTAPRSRSSRA